MMKFIRHKDAAGRLPEKENRKGSLRGILGLTLLVMFGAVLAAGGMGTRSYAGYFDPPGIEENGELVTFPGTTNPPVQNNMERNGETTSGRNTYVILYDGVNPSTDDLQDYIEGATLWQKNPETGEWEEVPAGDGVVLGNNYKLKVHFEGNHDGRPGFQKDMEWSLGDHVTCEPKNGAPVWDADRTTQIGTYDLTADGQVMVHFYESYLEGGNQKLDMEFNMVPTGVDEGGENKFPWSGEIEDENIIDSTGDLEVQKSAGYYSTTEGCINYTVEASVTAGMVTNGTLSDVMEDGLTFDGVKEITIYNSEGRNVTELYQEYINALMSQAEEQEGRSSWKLEHLPPLSQGMRFVVEYKGKVDDEKQTDRNYTAKNTVTFGGTKPDDTPAETENATAEKDLAKDQLTKTGNTTTIEETVDGKKVEKEVIQWQVRVGSGQWDPLESGDPLEMKDTLGDGLTFRQNEKIKVQWCDKDGKVKGEAEIDWKDVTITGDGKVAEYKLDESLFKGKKYEWAEGDYLMVTYNTDFDRTKQPENGFANTVENDILAPEGTTGRLPVGEAVQKTVVDNERDGYLTYTVIVDIPPCSHMKSMKDHSSDGHKGLDLPYFYIEDRLDFGDDYFVWNMPEPENITIHVESKDSTNYWDFEYVPYTNGPGNRTDDRETFQIIEGTEENETGGRWLRAFRIYFNTDRYGIGTDNELERHDSIWDIDEATRMTITYIVPYDAIVVDKAGKESTPQKTVGELLNQGMQLENRALSRRSGVDLDERCYWKKNPENGQVDKLARYLGGGVVEYQVSFINRNPNEDSRLITNDKDDNKGRYCEDLDPTLIDEFDERMEYVDGSLYVEVRSRSSNDLKDIFKYTGGNPAHGNRLEARILEFTEHTPGKESEHPTIEDTFREQRKYVFVYRLKLKDEYMKDWQPDENIENTATFKYGSNTPHDGTSIDIPSDMLQKNFEAVPEKNVLKYTLNVNPAGADLVTVTTNEEEVNLDSYKLVDEMSGNLQLVTEDGDYKITVEYWDGNDWQQLKRSPNSTGIKKSELNYFRGTDGENSIYFILPDELHIRITYEVIVNGAVNSQEVASNKATLYADHVEKDESKTIFEVGESGASGSSDPVVNLEKTDSKTDTQLQGAKFTLYCSDENAKGVDKNKTITVRQAGEEIKLYAVTETGDYVTGEFGEIKKIAHPDNAGKDALYALVETEAPEGYVKNEIPYFFRFPDYEGSVEDDKVTYKDEECEVHHTSANEIIKIENPPAAHPFRVIKVDTTDKELEGAEFALWSTKEKTDGTHDREKDTELWVGTSDENGLLKWKEPGKTDMEPADVLDLDPGVYYLYETKAPDGYNKLEEPVIIIVADGEVDGTLNGRSVKKTDGEGEALVIELRIPNSTGYELPETGGAGTSLLYLLGSMFILAGGMVLLYNRRLAQGRAGR